MKTNNPTTETKYNPVPFRSWNGYLLVFYTIFALLFFAYGCENAATNTAMEHTNEKGENDMGTIAQSAPFLNSDGKGGGTIVSNGKKYAVWGVETDLWRSVAGDLDMVDRYIEASLYINANAIAVHIPWRIVEPKKDVYDFHFLEECIGRAEKAELKVVLYFGCSNYAAGDPVFVPDYIKNDEKTYTQVKGRGFRDEPVAGHTALALCPGNPATLERERKAYCELMAYLRDCDMNRSVLAVHYGGEMNFIQSAKEGFIGWNNPELRCECEHCDAAYGGGGKLAFTTKQFADYIASVVDAGAAIYPVPVYAAVAPRSWWGGNWRGAENGEVRKKTVKFEGFFAVPSIAETKSSDTFRKEIKYYLPDKIPGNIVFASGIDTGHGTPGSPQEQSSVISWPHLEIAPWINIFEYKSLGAIYWDHPAVTVSDSASGGLVREKFRAFWSPLKAAGGKLVEIRDMPDGQMIWWTYEDTQKAGDIAGCAVSVEQEEGANYGYAFADGESLVLSASVYEGKATTITLTRAGGFSGCAFGRGAYDGEGNWVEWMAKEGFAPEISGDSIVVIFEGDNGDASRAMVRIEKEKE